MGFPFKWVWLYNIRVAKVVVSNKVLFILPNHQFLQQFVVGSFYNLVLFFTGPYYEL
jgi:hypothetical protein